MYDFEDSGAISLDEMVLAFRASLSGLCKLSSIHAPSEAEIEIIVALGFTTYNLLDAKNQPKVIDREQFLTYCLNTPEVMSWINFFDDVNSDSVEIKQSLPSHLERTVENEAMMHPLLGGEKKLEMERNPSRNPQPWRNAILSLASVTPSSETLTQPPHQFTMEWVYGYNGHSSRQNLRYSYKGLVIYPAAAICILLDPIAKTQMHFHQHHDIITCIQVYFDEESTIVATGEAGWRPSLLVWEAESLKLLSSMVGFHRNGILFTDFSPDKSKLVSIGGDEYHSMAVYAWRTRQLLWSARTMTALVADARFLRDDLIVTLGMEHVTFWRTVKGLPGYRRNRGDFGSLVKPEMIWCAAIVEENVVVGAESGALYVWEGRNMMRTVKAHADAILACYVIEDKIGKGLLTACRLGKVQIWNSALEIRASFNCTALGPTSNPIISVCQNQTTKRILLGFQSCEIFEIDGVDGRNAHKKPLHAGHFQPRVSGLAAHPDDPSQFCTVGDDRTVRVYDSKKHEVLRMAQMDTMGRCVAYSPDGQMLVIGLGSGVIPEERKEGAFLVLAEEDLTIVFEERDTKAAIVACSYSPNQEYVAVSSLDGCIYVYNAKDHAPKSRCKGHAAGVSHLDFSADGRFLMTNSTAGELLFWLVETGETQPPRTVRDIEWETNSCVYSLDTQGIWNSTERAQYRIATISHALDLVVAVDDMGRIKVMSYPSLHEGSNFTVLRGHGAHVQSCVFASDDSVLYTTGGTDGTVIQWRVTVPAINAFDNLPKNDLVNDLLPFEISFDGKNIDRSDNFAYAMEDQPIPVCLYEEGVVEIAPLLPWQRSIIGPSKLSAAEDLTEPPDSLELAYVYGFNVNISRESLQYANDGDALFLAGAIVVKMNVITRKQRYFVGHSCTVTALAVCSGSTIVASGQMGQLPPIHIWDSTSLQTVGMLRGYHRRAIGHLQFSRDSRLLVSVGKDDFHSVAVYDWRNLELISCSNGFRNESLAISFSPAGDSLVQCGNEIVRFWDMEGLHLKHQDGIIGARAVIQAFLCVGWVGSSPIVGTADGNLYRFIGRQLDGIVKAHEGPIQSIASHTNGLLTCSNDGFIKNWARILDCTHVINIKDYKCVSLNIRCLNWHNDGRILFGTASGDIFELGADGKNIHRGPISEGHGGDIGGIAVHPSLDIFVTTGDDALLRVWDSTSHCALRTVELEMPSRCCAYSTDAKRIAVGFGSPIMSSTGKKFEGKWVLFETSDFHPVFEARDSMKYLTEMKYAPNGEILAIGSADNKIYVYNMLANCTLIATLGQHHSFITGIDFSSDSGWIQSNCGGYELHFFEADTGMFVPNHSRMRDTEWASQNCTMGWPVQGLWTPYRDGVECTAVDCNFVRRDSGVVVVGGDNFGRLSLARYPCLESKAMTKRYKYCANPINRIRFTPNDAYLFALCGSDKLIMQFAHHREITGDLAHDSVLRDDLPEEGKEDLLELYGRSAEIAETSDAVAQIGGRTWIAYAIAPSSPAEVNLDPPDLSLQIEHVIGLQAEMIRSNVGISPNGDVIIPCSRYICAYSKQANHQVLYQGHGTTLSCVATSQDHQLVASAERCPRPSIHVWSVGNCQVLIILPVYHRRGVASLQFSSDRGYLLSVGLDEDHSIALWHSPTGEWVDGHLSASGKAGVQPVTFASYYISTNNIAASGGSCHVKFWELNGRCLNPNYAEYPRTVKLGLLTCGAQLGHYFVSGSASGVLFIWKGRVLDRSFKAHGAAISAIWSQDSVGLVTVSKDGVMQQWSKNMEHIKTFSISDADVIPILKGLQSIDVRLTSDDGAIKQMIATTVSAETYEISAKSGNIYLLSEAHYTGELWGLAAHPTDPDIFATAGDDKTLRYRNGYGCQG